MPAPRTPPHAPGSSLDSRLRDIGTTADRAGDDPAALTELLARVTDVHRELGDARRHLAELAPALVIRALRAGVSQSDLIGRPYAATVVRRLARQAGLPPQARGPRRKADRSRVDAALAREPPQTGG